MLYLFCLILNLMLSTSLLLSSNNIENSRIGKFFIKSEQIHYDDSSDNFFNAAVYPILDSKCIICHNDRRSQGGLNMMTEKSILHGGLSGS